MFRKFFYAVCFLLITTSVFSQTTVKGFVFEDLNGNGKKDRREKGIANVAVSDGINVVLTNANGQYLLQTGNDNTIFVIKPSGYQTVIDDNNLPAYYYHHKPEGSPQMKYPGVAPTGKLPASVDFALRKNQENDDFKILVFGDPQAYNMDEVRYFGKGIVSEVAGIQNIAFGISLGDLVGDRPDLFKPYINEIKRVGVPWYNVMGNHDMNFDAKHDSLSDESFQAHFGLANYAFNYGKVHFLVLDNILYPDPRDGKGYWGGFTESQFAFIENNLRYVPKDYLVVLAYHIPIISNANSVRMQDQKRLFELLKEFPHTLSLSAHTHRMSHFFLGKEDGWLQEKPHHHFNAGATSGNWYSGQLNENGVPVSMMSDGTPKGYSFLNFNGNKYTIDYKVAGMPAERQINIFAPKVVAQNGRTSSSIYANFFMGHKTDEVLFRVNEGEWRKMNYTEEVDPFYNAELLNWDLSDTLLTGRRPGPIAVSQHLWKAPAPTRLEPGQHTIEVKATDMFGKTHYGKRTYRVVAAK